MKEFRNFRDKHSSEINLFIIFIVVFLIMGILSKGRFFSGNNIQTMAFQIPEFGFMSLAMMVAVLTGGINLSITTSAALCSIISAFVLSSDISKENPVLAIFLSLIVCIFISILTGILNGYIIAYIGVASMLVTLGTKTLFEGLGLNVTKGGSISGFPSSYSFLGNGSILKIPFPMIIFIIMIVITYFLFERSAWGTEIYMVGCNETATRFSGINTKKTLMLVYIYSSIMAGVASIFISSRYNSAKTDYGSSYLMQSITAVVLGGTDIMGGSGSVAGTIIAVLIIQTISTGLNLIGVDRYIINIIIGGILIFVLALKFISAKVQDAKKIKKRILQAKS